MGNCYFCLGQYLCIVSNCFENSLLFSCRFKSSIFWHNQNTVSLSLFIPNLGNLKQYWTSLQSGNSLVSNSTAYLFTFIDFHSASLTDFLSLSLSCFCLLSLKFVVNFDRTQTNIAELNAEHFSQPPTLFGILFASRPLVHKSILVWMLLYNCHNCEKESKGWRKGEMHLI